jgi:hypothetical protein
MVVCLRRHQYSDGFLNSDPSNPTNPKSQAFEARQDWVALCVRDWRIVRPVSELLGLMMIY